MNEKQSTSPEDPGRGNENRSTNKFIGIEELLKQFDDQLLQFEEWNQNQDWLAFHHHHYDWWMFPIDEISSRGPIYKLNEEAINELKTNEKFIRDLRRGVQLMVRSWGWDIANEQFFPKRDEKQKWSYWPVRLYKAGKCMWLFNQNDYYQSLRKLAHYIKDIEREKLDYFSHRLNSKADVLEQWNRMEQKKSS